MTKQNEDAFSKYLEGVRPIKKKNNIKKTIKKTPKHLISVKNKIQNKEDREKKTKDNENNQFPKKDSVNYLGARLINDYKDKITGNYTPAKFANMANLFTSLEIVKNENCDLFYLVEDDYIHTKDSIAEMLFTFEKFSTIFEDDIFLLPADYPYLYLKNENTKIFLGNQKHWRLVEESLVTFLTTFLTI